MTAADVLAVGLPMLAGLTLVFRSLPGILPAGGIAGVRARIARAHMALHVRAVATGILRFPGARLVSSARGWIAGEATFVAASAAGIALDPSPRAAPTSVLAALALGGSVAYLANRDLARRQLDGIRTALPIASFLMSLLLEAGMGSHAALLEATRALPRGPLADELEELARSRTIGVRRADAMEKSRARVPLEEYRTFLNLIEQGERLGVGLSQALGEHAARMMEAQGHRAELVAQQAAVKLLFPLVVFIFPAVFLVILSPVILSLWAMLGR